MAFHSVDRTPDTLDSPSLDLTLDAFVSHSVDHMPDITLSHSVCLTPHTTPSPSVWHTRACLCLSTLAFLLLVIFVSNMSSAVSQLYDKSAKFSNIAHHGNLTVNESASLPLSRASNATVPDERFNNIAFMIHSGKEVVDVRFPAQFNSFLRSVKNYILVGDANISNAAGTGVDMIDVVHNVVEDAEARIKYGNSENSSPRLHRRRIEDTQGWKDDAHKYFPGFRVLHERFPDAHWYMICDDDAYVFVENLHEALSSYDHKAHHYMGRPLPFGGCDLDKRPEDRPLFAHGGSGLIISQAAMKAMLKHVDQCIVKYQACWAGDIRVAMCMRDAGIFVTNPLTYQQHSDPPTLHKFNYPKDACIRPITFHHLIPKTMRLVHHSIEIARTRINSDKAYWDSASNVTHLYAPDQKHGDVPAAQNSPHYAPVHFDDVYQVFVNPYNGPPYNQKNQPLIHLGHSRESDAHQAFKVDPNRSALECHEKCVSDPICRAWDLDMVSLNCRLIQAIPELKPNLNSVTGVVLDRFVCNKHTR